jgi:aminopeptidase N
MQSSYDAEKQQLLLRCRQEVAGSALPLVVPLCLGLLSAHGRDMKVSCNRQHSRATAHEAGDDRHDLLLILDSAETSFVIDGVVERPVVTYLRGLSAPVRLHMQRSLQDLSLLAAHDCDGVSRWFAVQELWNLCFFSNQSERPMSVAAISAAFTAIAVQAFEANSKGNSGSDKLWMFARLCAAPTLPFMMQQQAVQTPHTLWALHRTICCEIAVQTQDIIQQLLFDGTPSLDSIRWRKAVTQCSAHASSPEEMAQRAAFDAGMHLLCCARGDVATRALQLSKDLVLSPSHPMTCRMAALQRLLQSDSECARDMRLSASQAFFCEWQGNELVLQSWMAAHAGSGASDTLQRVHDIYNSSCFRLDVPNDVYALLVTFARSSPCQLYSTAGLALVVDAVLLLDKSNPQVAARLVRCFSDVHSLCAQECAGAVDSVRRIAAAAVSPDVKELCSRILDAAA